MAAGDLPGFIDDQAKIHVALNSAAHQAARIIFREEPFFRSLQGNWGPRQRFLLLDIESPTLHGVPRAIAERVERLPHGADFEDQILAQVDIEAALSKLPPSYAVMMLLVYKVKQPDDWEAQWPPRFEDIGWYIGMRFRGHPLSEAAIRYRRDQVEAMWRGERGPLRHQGE